MSRFGAGPNHPMLGVEGTFTTQQVLDLLAKKADEKDFKVLFETVSKLRSDFDTLRKEMKR